MESSSWGYKLAPGPDNLSTRRFYSRRSLICIVACHYSCPNRFAIDASLRNHCWSIDRGGNLVLRAKAVLAVPPRVTGVVTFLGDDLCAGGLRRRASLIASGAGSICHCRVERKRGRIRCVKP